MPIADCSDCCFLFPKCAKIHLRVSSIPKIFPGVITPLKGRSRGLGGKERLREIDGEGIETKEGRKE